MAESNVYLVASLSTLAVLTVVFNVFVCFLVYFNRALRKYTNWLIVSLAVSDILTGGALFPMHLIKPSSVVTNFLAGIILLSSVANLCSLTYDRYIAIIKPLEYQYRVPKMFKRAVILSWLIPVICSLLPLFWNTDPELKIHKVYIICLQLFGVIVPFIFIAFSYIRIFKEVRRSLAVKKNFQIEPQRGQKNEKRRISPDANVAKVFCIISAIFILCWLPIIYMTTANVVLNRLDAIPEALATVSFFTIAISSLVNPIIYAFLKPDFKMAIGNFVRRPIRERNDRNRQLKHRGTLNIRNSTSIL